ncbi:MAG: LAGLIDADG family homing endonuclease [Candidatus Scalindua sp.]|nr:LAGLIDADG family homing endonuclease [Candidatus Scalindua sp.]
MNTFIKAGLMPSLPKTDNGRDGVVNEREKIAFTAGFIDADGHFCVIKQTKKYKEKELIYKYPQVVVVQKDPNICYWLKNNYGGSIGNQRNKKTGSTWKMWTLRGKKAVELAKKVQPYLITKKEKVEILFEIDKQYKNTCKYCGKQFVSNFQNQKFCNSECRVKNSKVI